METNQAIDYLLHHVAAVLSKQVDQALQEQLGIGVSQYKILTTLEVSPELGQSAIANHLGQTEASISRQIKLLVQKGLLKTEVNMRSRREHLATLTPKGGKLTQAGRQVVEQYNLPMIDTLTEKQQKQLADSLVVFHAWACRAGKTTACDHPYAI